MIGSTTTFYEDSLHAIDQEPEGEYTNAYLQQFPSQTQYHEYSSLFPPYVSQPFAQPTQYLPTPSVSPTSTSGRQIATVTHQSPTQYYALNGAMDQHPQIPKFEQPNLLLDNARNIDQLDRSGPSQRPKPKAKAPAKAAASRKRPKKSADDAGRGTPIGEESDGEERNGDEPRPIQRL